MNIEEKEPVLAIVGPTGSGKTEASLAAAAALGAEIISMDSMQIYRGMDIGTAKAKPEEQHGIPHHLIDIAEITDSFTAADYKEKAVACIQDIRARGKIPLLVGGTGLYLDAIRYDMQFSGTDADPEYRELLHRIADSEGGHERLHRMLEDADPAAAAKLHPNDVRRVVRALEVARSRENGSSVPERQALYPVFAYGIEFPRDVLYEHIDKRVDKMVKLGLRQETERLVRAVPAEKWGSAAQAIGYKEWFPVFEGTMTGEEAVFLIKRNSRRYAKRQLTWFRRDPEIRWLDAMSYPDKEMMFQDLISRMKSDLQNFSRNKTSKDE